jgi:hypothetical protein
MYQLRLDYSRFECSAESCANLSNLRSSDPISFEGSKFTGTLNMRGAEIKDLFMNSAEFTSGVDLVSAEIGGQLSISQVKFNDLLDMDRLQVDGDLFMSDAEFGKDVSLVFSNLNSSLDLSYSTFASFDLTGTQIRGPLVLNGTSWSEGAQLMLADTAAGILQYTEEAWPKKLDLNGFTCASLSRVMKNGNPVDRDLFDASWFKCWLARQEQYAPQPYEQLANVLLKQGYEKESRDTLHASRERT